MLNQIKIVLSQTTHPGNIGAIARAMKVMGLHHLRLVNPHCFPSQEASKRASHAADILHQATLFESIESAVSDCTLIVGSSIRQRSLSTRLVTPRELTQIMIKNSNRVPVALLFGTESSGLTNEELSLCHYQVYIPTNPVYSSLNLAQAVQLICYEMRLAFESTPTIKERVSEKETPITREQLTHLLAHLKKTMTDVGYLKTHQKQIDQRLNRLFSRSDITESEYMILRGFFSSIEKTVNQKQTENKKDGNEQ
jgi:TrmH family RNA methyltransferase